MQLITTNTVQVAWVLLHHLRQWLDKNAPPAQVAASDNHHPCTNGAFHSSTAADSPLAHVVLSHSATCSGGAYVHMYYVFLYSI